MFNNDLFDKFISRNYLITCLAGSNHINDAIQNAYSKKIFYPYNTPIPEIPLTPDFIAYKDEICEYIKIATDIGVIEDVLFPIYADHSMTNKIFLFSVYINNLDIYTFKYEDAVDIAGGHISKFIRTVPKGLFYDNVFSYISKEKLNFRKDRFIKLLKEKTEVNEQDYNNLKMYSGRWSELSKFIFEPSDTNKRKYRAGAVLDLLYNEINPKLYSKLYPILNSEIKKRVLINIISKTFNKLDRSIIRLSSYDFFNKNKRLDK